MDWTLFGQALSFPKSVGASKGDGLTWVWPGTLPGFSDSAGNV